jgi:hypothetical protein
MISLFWFVIFALFSTNTQAQSVEPTHRIVFDAGAEESPEYSFHGARWKPDGSAFALWSDFAFLAIDAASGEIIIDADGMIIDDPAFVNWRDDGQISVLQFELDPEAGSWNRNDQLLWETATYVLLPGGHIGQHTLSETDGAAIFTTKISITPFGDQIIPSPDGTMFALGGMDGFAVIASSGTVLHESFYTTEDYAMECDAQVRRIAWRPDGKVLAVSSLSNIPILFDTSSGTVSEAVAAQGELVWRPDAAQFAVVGAQAALYDLSGNQQFALEHGGSASVYSPDGSRLVVQGGAETYVYDTSTGQLVLTAPHEGSDNRFCGPIPVASVLSPDGSRLLTWSYEYPELATGITARVYVEDEGLKLRAGPGTSHEVVATMPVYTEVIITGDVVQDGGFRWWPLRMTDGTEGYAVESADGIATLLPTQLDTIVAVWDIP